MRPLFKLTLAGGPIVLALNATPVRSQDCWRVTFEDCCYHRLAAVPCVEDCGNEPICCSILRFDLTEETWYAEGGHTTGWSSFSITHLTDDCYFNRAFCNEIISDPPCCDWHKVPESLPCHDDFVTWSMICP